ncbi:MAG: GNAT family N-acetyltransferase [Bacilli bacterium]
MKAVIMCAGMGTRLGVDFPKALLKIDGKTLLEHKVTGLRDAGITDICVVTGFKHEMFPQDLGVTYVHNDKFSDSGNAYSFYLALKECGTDDYVVVLDGDLMLDYRIYFEIQPKFQYFVDNLGHHWKPGELGIKVDFNNRIVDIGREYDYCVMLGFAVYPPEFIRRVFKHLNTNDIQKEELIGIVRKYINSFHAVPEFVHYDWMEVDTKEDYEKAKKLFDTPKLDYSNGITLKELNSLYKDMGEFGGLHLSMRSLERDGIILRNSTYAVVRRNGRVIGSGRIFSDGAYAVAIWDVMVRPSYQRQGVGTLIVERLFEEAEKLHPIKVFLIADPGKEDFYRKFGMELTRAPAMEKRYDYDKFSPNWKE